MNSKNVDNHIYEIIMKHVLGNVHLPVSRGPHANQLSLQPTVAEVTWPGISPFLWAAPLLACLASPHISLGLSPIVEAKQAFPLPSLPSQLALHGCSYVCLKRLNQKPQKSGAQTQSIFFALKERKCPVSAYVIHKFPREGLLLSGRTSEFV